MATTETPTSGVRTDDATTLYWELDNLRAHLTEAMEEYDVFTGSRTHQSLLEVLPGPLRHASAAVKDVQAALAEVIVKQAGPAAESR